MNFTNPRLVSQGLNERHVTWEYYGNGHQQEAVVRCIDNLPLEISADRLPLLFWGGYGENAWANRRVILGLGRMGVRAMGVIMPYDQLPADRDIVDRASAQIPHLVADTIRRQSGAHTDKKLAVLARSQGGGIIGRAVRDRSEGIGNMALIAPVCYDRQESDERSDLQRIAQFSGRFLLNGLRQFVEAPNDAVNWKSIFPIGRQVAYDMLTGRYVPKVAVAMNTILNKTILEHVAAGHKVVHLIGGCDRVFRYGDVRASYAQFESNVEKWPNILSVKGNSHVASPSKRGMAEFALALNHLGIVGDEYLPADPHPVEAGEA
jgi:hypothetical protein